jgi:UDP-N-acetylmuramyl pentapeptide phosphotransferase/UDP-N-acetylglucosamine-1-phosphate transferase
MLILNDYLLLGIIILFSNAFILFLIKNSKKKFLGNLLDCEFSKVQSFHKKPVLKIGGIFIFFFITISFLLFKNSELLRNIFYLVIPIFFFSLLEDLKIKINPFIRLIILLLIIFFSVKSFNLKIYSVQFYNFDNYLNSNQIFSYIFTALCIVFVINGSNFIDGFNGLLGIHSSIIILILSIINFYFGNFELLFICILFLICLAIFLTFNFPNSKIFLGNSGSYLLGLVLAILVILTSQKTQYHKVYPFFFACLLNYIFFETFFSFFRKIVYEKKNPLYPDKKHLHMLVFSYFKTHVKTTLSINFFYILTMVVALFFFTYPGLLKILFILQILLYITIYLLLVTKKK